MKKIAEVLLSNLNIPSRNFKKKEMQWLTMFRDNLNMSLKVIKR